MSYKRLGDYIQLIDKKNKDLAITNLLGINIFKNYMPSVANQTNLDLSKYKVVSKGQFATNLMHVNRDEVLPVALYTDEKPALVSPAYKTFEVIDENELLPEFLMMEFQRSDFERYARFNSWGSARETFDWAEMCNVKLPIPDIKIQEAIVTIYHTLEARKRINEQLKDSIKPLCPVLMRGVVEEMKIGI